MNQPQPVPYHLRPLVTTKLHLPQQKYNLVFRPQLVARLNASLHGKLTLICAPPGFGKTTLISQWLADTNLQAIDLHTVGLHTIDPQAGESPPLPLRQRTAWVALSEDDNDLGQFWRYVLTALAEGPIGVGAHLLAAWQAATLPLQTILKGLINELAALSDDVLLILDDYHVIEQQAIHDSLLFLLDHLPPNCHLVLLSRADPPWPLARLRLNGELVELRAADLHFSTAETIAFFQQVMKINLSPADVALVEARTEGWVAGLQAVALSLQGRGNPAEFIQTLSGSHRYVLDYLVEEVLQRQPAILQTFLLYTALSDHLCGSLCDALMGWDTGTPPCEDVDPPPTAAYPDSQAILEQLEAANLFTLPLDDERRWYRYHHLFRDLLYKRLQTSAPACVAELHRRAAHWYAQHDSPLSGITHALAAQDFILAANLIAAEARTLIQQGEVRRLARWLAALPTACVHAHAGLCLARAWVHLFLSEFTLIEPALQDTEQALMQQAARDHTADRGLESEMDAAQIKQIGAEVQAIRAVITILHGQLSAANALAEESRRHLSGRSPLARSMLGFVYGVSARTQGDLAAAHRAFAEAQALSEAGNSLLTALLAGYHLGSLQMEQGQLHLASALYQQALDLVDRLTHLGDQELPAVGAPHVGLGRLLLEWHELTAAHEHLVQGVQLTGQKGGMGLAVDGYMALALLYHYRGEQAALLEAMQQVEARLHRSPHADALERLADFQAHMALLQGNQLAVAHWAQASDLDAEDALTYANRGRYLLFARWLIEQQRYPTAERLLTRLYHFATGLGVLGNVIETLTLQARLAYERGQEPEAIDTLHRALTLAEPEGYIQLFVNQGATLHKLLATVSATLNDPPIRTYLERVRAACLAPATCQPPSSSGLVLAPSLTPTLALLEPLSERELTVLQLLAAGASNQDIAEELVIALTTAKKHVSNIIGKLGVVNRTQAVAQARTLGLLS